MTDYSLKIGLDYHGVIDKKPEYFAEFCRLARLNGHKIYIITGGPTSAVREDLERNRIAYDFIFAISDYYQALGKVELSADGNFVIPDELWKTAKAEFCCRNHINIHIDDSCDYLNWFSTPFCLYSPKGDVCVLSSGVEIDFSRRPDEVIAAIETLTQTFCIESHFK